MKTRNIFLLLALLIGAGNALADNQLKVRDIAITKEGKTVLAIETDFEKDNFIGYQLDITLPKGLSMALNSNNKPVTTSYTELEIDGSVYSSTEETTTYRLIASKMGNPRIPAGAYVLLTATIVADASVDVGDVKTCLLTGINFSDASQTKTKCNEVNFNVTVTDKVVLDENSPVAPVATDDEAELLVKRTIKAHE